MSHAGLSSARLRGPWYTEGQRPRGAGFVASKLFAPQRDHKASPAHKHGPYYQLSYTRKGKDGTRFVKKADVPAIREAMAN